MNVKIAMNQQKRRSLSVMFTFLIITTLILIGPAQAVQVNIITEPNNAVAGEDVIFVAEVKIEDQDAYVPITYTILSLKVQMVLQKLVNILMIQEFLNVI
jgi:hypothetical protein